MATALLVVDVQEFYVDESTAHLPSAIANHIEALSYDAVVFSVFRNTPESNFTKSLKWTKCGRAEDATLPEELKRFSTGKNVFERSTYSAFNCTELHDLLQSQDIDRLILCGVDTDACVLATAFDAFDLGYHVKVEFSLTHSGNNLQQAAEDIIRKTISSRD